MDATLVASIGHVGPRSSDPTRPRRRNPLRHPRPRVTPGQICVPYDGDGVIAGGPIASAIQSESGSGGRKPADRFAIAVVTSSVAIAAAGVCDLV